MGGGVPVNTEEEEEALTVSLGEVTPPGAQEAFVYGVD